jgi:hypothetical protein
MFKNIFINRLKCFIRERSLVFWTLLFPLVLSTFFYIAFNNIDVDNKFKAIPLGVVNDEKYQENMGLVNLIDSLSKEDENKVFEVSYVNKEEAVKLLKDDEIIGYIIIDNELNLVINKNGIEATITKSVLDNYLQVSSSINNIISISFSLGVVFEVPVIVYFLTRIGLITPSFMRKSRKIVLVILLIIAAIITPPDIFSQIMVTIPLVILYELSIFVSVRVYKKMNV